MLVCEDCFADEELRKEIATNSTSSGVCDVCGSERKLYDLNNLREFFVALLHIFEKNNNGIPVVELIQNDWNIFSSNDIGRSILSEVIACDSSITFTIDDSVDYVKSTKDGVSAWEELKKEVKEESRFFSDIDEFKKFNILIPNWSLKKRDILYRARVIPENLVKLAPKDMGCPPKDKTTAGRANPLGIPYLYLCEDEETTYYEVRAVYLDKLAVGKFIIQRDLSIVNFHYNISLYLEYADGASSLEEMVTRKKVVDAISADLSRPLRRYDSEIEYVPTQLICEYCRLITNADGICFESSLRKGHSNYVLFDQNSAKCSKVEIHEIKKIIISKES